MQPSYALERRPRESILRELLVSCTVEIAPWDTTSLQTSFATGIAEMFMPWIPKATMADLVCAVEQVRACGYSVVPHIAARRLRHGELALLSRLRDEHRVQGALLIAGDVDHALGPFDSSLDLLRSRALSTFGIRRVGFAGYPERHPSITSPAIMAALGSKIREARAQGIEAFIVSQFCFDAAAIVKWIQGLRSAGIALPIQVGLAGPANAIKLFQLAVRCGVTNTVGALKGRLASVSKLMAYEGPTDLVEELAAALESSPELQPVSIHLFAFGGVRSALQWRKNRLEHLSGP